MKNITFRKNVLVSSIALAIAMFLPTAYAGDGHDHGDAAPSANSNGPKRLPDGSVFLPKPAQHQMLLRSAAAIESQLPRSTELAGKVIMDANAGGKVQALQAGRIEAVGAGLPNLGQPVKKGQVLAYVASSASALERANQAAQVAELNSNQSTLERRLARLQSLSDTVPRKEMEAVEGELLSIKARSNALKGALGSKEALIAPVSGVIALSNVVSGQVVEAKEVLFEIVDPTRLKIEALAYDTQLIGNIASASTAHNGTAIALTYAGAAASLREQVLPIQFKAQNLGLAKFSVGQAVNVTVQHRNTIKGFALTSAAVVKNPSNQNAVWVKTAPERFEMRTVIIEPLDATRLAVTSGLKAGDRVVVQAANLLNQIR